MYYGLGSSFGGCGVPSNKDRYTVSNPTSNNHHTNYLSCGNGNSCVGHYGNNSNSAYRKAKSGEWKCNGGGFWYKD